MLLTETLLKPDDVFNRQLLQNAHPPAWVNPKPHDIYNLVVLGAGTAGLVATAGAAALGARVALIEERLMGGDCLNFGCVPSKAVIRASRAAHALQEGCEYGGNTAAARFDFPKAMERMRRLRAEISSHDSVQRFTSLGAQVFLGAGQFVSRDIVEVDGLRLRFTKAIIATGGRPARPEISGLSEAGFLTNETVFSLTELPTRLVVLGAGPIGCELAQAFQRLGSQVTMITRGARILPREDPDVSALLMERFEHEGMQIIVEATIRHVEQFDGEKIIRFARGASVGDPVADPVEDPERSRRERSRREEKVSGTEILVSVGRVANVEGLNLKAAGVEYDAKGVKVDDRLRTTNPNIYAAGDVCSSFKFTHAAETMSRIALQNALFFGRKKASNLVIPWTTYTDPEVAHAGFTEQGARNHGFTVETFTLPFAEVDRAILDGETGGFARIHMDAKTRRILGATLVSRHAGESIGELVLAMTQRLRLEALGGVIHPYPTQAEVIKRLGDASLRSRLKPWMRKLLEKYFSFRRKNGSRGRAASWGRTR
jgi:pyruvate/2-oxoglutarate dehydrogenase complex dihydrolipoamide dehydrogenase (E3) component